MPPSKKIILGFAVGSAVLVAVGVYNVVSAFAPPEASGYSEVVPATLSAGGETPVCQFIPGLEVEASEDNFATLTPLNGDWQFSGRLSTPSPNYSYEFGPLTLHADEARMDLNLITPEGAQLAVIDKVDLQAQFSLPGKPSRLRIRVQREFYWGPQEILCSLLHPAP